MALSSSARLDDVIRSTTSEGDALHLFADDSSPEFATAGRRPGRQSRRWSTARRSHRTCAGESCASAARTSSARWPESAARATARSTAWINRAVGLRSVADATVEQLERSVARLERELRR